MRRRHGEDLIAVCICDTSELIMKCECMQKAVILANDQQADSAMIFQGEASGTV